MSPCRLLYRQKFYEQRGHLETEVQDVYLARKQEFCNGMHNLSFLLYYLMGRIIEGKKEPDSKLRSKKQHIEGHKKENTTVE